MNYTCSSFEYLSNALDDIKRNYKQDSIVNISSEIIKQPKTLKQLGFIFGGLVKALSAYFMELGYFYPTRKIIDWLYCQCKVFSVEKMPDNSEFITGKTLSDMNKEEASKFIQDVIFFIDNSPILKDFILLPELRYCWTHNVDAEQIEHVKSIKINNFDKYYLLHQSKLTCIRCGAQGGMVYHLKRPYKKDYLTLPFCAKCYSDVDSRGESYLIRDIKAVLNGLTLEDFCLMVFYYWQKYY